MSLKTIFIVVVSVLLTIILMNNTESVNFWFFGDIQIPKLVILGTIFIIGFIIGVIATRPSVKTKTSEVDENNQGEITDRRNSSLSDEDREYIQ